MDKLSQLKKNLRALVAANANLPIHAKVIESNGDVCTVEIDGMQLTDVRLKSTTGESDGLLLTPTKGSDVTLLSSDGTLDNLMVIKMNKIDKVQSETGDFKMEIDLVAGKVGIKNSTTGLYELFNQLQQLLKNLKVYTPSGPSGTPLPDSIAAIAQFENDFKTILKQL